MVYTKYLYLYTYTTLIFDNLRPEFPRTISVVLHAIISTKLNRIRRVIMFVTPGYRVTTVVGNILPSNSREHLQETNLASINTVYDLDRE